MNYRKDGSSYLVEWNISPVRDAQGQVQAYVSVQQDITARVRAEQRQALLARALNATQDAVVIANEQAQILFVNQAFEDLTGYRSDEVLGRTPKFLQSGEHPPLSTANCAMPWHAVTAARPLLPIGAKTAASTTRRRPLPRSGTRPEPPSTTSV